MTLNKCTLSGVVLEKPKLTFVKKHPICAFNVAVSDYMGNVSCFPVRFIGSDARKVYTQVIETSKIYLEGELSQERSPLNYVQAQVRGKKFELTEQKEDRFMSFKKGLYFDILSLKAKATFWIRTKMAKKEAKQI